MVFVRGILGDPCVRLGTAGLLDGELVSGGFLISTAFADMARTRASPIVMGRRGRTPEVGVGGCSMEGGLLVDEGSVRLDTLAESVVVGVDRAVGDERGLGSGERIRGEIIGRGEERGETTGLSLSM